MTEYQRPPGRAALPPGPRYKWMALFVSTLGMLMATIDSSIILIAMPQIFRGIKLDPLQPGNSFFLLWMILGFLIVSSVLVVSLGRLGDMFGRVRMYNLGFLIFAIASIMLSIDWLHGSAGALWLIGFRIVQGIGGANISANSGAILTDAFGMALSKLADGSVMVIEAERTRAPVAAECKRLIEDGGGRLLGAVMNRRRLYIPDYLYRLLYQRVSI